MIFGSGEGNRCGLSHLATDEGSHNGRSHFCLNAVPLHPQPLVVHHLLDAFFDARAGGWALVFVQSKHMYAYDLIYLAGVVSVPPAAGGTAP